MPELERLIRELHAATSVAGVQDVLRLSRLSNLSPAERRQLLAALPAWYRTQLSHPDALRATVATLQAMNVESGTAANWARTTPWRQNPWQLLQVSAARAMIASMPLLPGTIRGPLQRMAKALALGARPTEAWAEVEAVQASQPGPSSDIAVKLAGRFLMASWTAMHREPAGVHWHVGNTIQRVALATGQTLSSKSLEEAVDQAVSMTRLEPEAVANLFATKATAVPVVASVEIMAWAAVLRHLENHAEAEAALSRFLQE